MDKNSTAVVVCDTREPGPAKWQNVTDVIPSGSFFTGTVAFSSHPTQDTTGLFKRQGLAVVGIDVHRWFKLENNHLIVQDCRLIEKIEVTLS